MDFRLSEDQENIRALARRIFETEASPAKLKELDKEGAPLHRKLWEELARAELLGVAIPTEHGGTGLGFIELCLLLIEQGRTAAPVPLLPTLVFGALPLARFGTTYDAKRLLRRICNGELIVTSALWQPGAAEVRRPSMTATKTQGGYRLSGSKTSVMAAELAESILIFAQTTEGSTLGFVVDNSNGGLQVEPQHGATRENLGRVVCDNAFVSNESMLAPTAGGLALEPWLHARAMVAVAAVQLGASETALAMLAEHAKTRVQFERPIGSFQAVAQRAADAYIDVEAMRLSLWEAAWKLSLEREATQEALVAKYWAAEAGHRVARAAQHLHGGLGVDCDFPLHRFVLLTKHLELTLGGANHTLAQLGQSFAGAEHHGEPTARDSHNT